MVIQIPDAVQLSDDVKASGLLDMQIPGDNIANYAFTDLDADNGLGDLVIDDQIQDSKDDTFNFLDTGNGSDDTDIVGDDDLDIPCSKIQCKDPYPKSNVTAAVTHDVQETDKDAVEPPDMASAATKKSNEER